MANIPLKVEKNCWLSAHFNFFETLLFKTICLKGFFINTRDQRDRSQKWVKFGIINNPLNSLCPDLQYVSICDLKSSTLIKLCYHSIPRSLKWDFSYYARVHVISADPNDPFAGFTIEFCAAVAVLLTGITNGMLYEFFYWSMCFDSCNTYLWHPWQLLQVAGSIENSDWEGQP